MFLMAAKLAKLPMPPPYLQPGDHQFQDGTNFASAGAGILVDTDVGTVCDPLFSASNPNWIKVKALLLLVAVTPAKHFI